LSATGTSSVVSRPGTKTKKASAAATTSLASTGPSGGIGRGGATGAREGATGGPTGGSSGDAKGGATLSATGPSEKGITANRNKGAKKNRLQDSSMLNTPEPQQEDLAGSGHNQWIATSGHGSTMLRHNLLKKGK
jgi:hypothetical protein